MNNHELNIEKKVDNHKLDIEEYLFQLHAGKLYMQSLQLDITNTCNCKCPFCLQGDHKQSENELTFEEISKILHDAKKLQVFNVGFDGGEPFARKDFHRILKLASDLGFSISIASNAHLIDEEDVELLKTYSLSKISISFHSIERNIYNKMFGISGNEYDLALKNIQMMLQKGIHVGIAVTITNLNLQSIPDTIKYFRSLGIKSNDIGLNHLIAGKKEIETLRLTVEEKTNLTKYLLGEGIESCLRGCFLCKAGRNALSISYDGIVYACPLLQTPAGDLRKNDLNDIWVNSEYLKLIRSLKPEHFEKCVNCSARSHCQMCLRNNLFYNNDIFDPYEETCAVMKIVKG